MDDELDHLYAVPLAAFVAERDALAKKLRGAGDRDRATEVKALSKPSRAAAAVNRLVREHPAQADALAEAAGGLADAQAEVLAGGDPAALRERTEAARAAVAQLVAELPAGESAATRGAVEDTLRAALVDPRVLAEVRSGRLEKERAAAGFGGLTAGPLPGKTRRAAAPSTTKAEDGDAARRAAADREERERAEAARAEREREERRRQAALRRAKEAEATAQTDLAAAERALEQVEAARRGRREDVKQATARLRDARRRREREEQRS